MLQRPDIFDYLDYRKYFSEWIVFSRQEKTSNLSQIARKLSVHTSFLTHVVSGKKNFSLEQAAELADLWQFTQQERDYWLLLVNIEKAGTSKLKAYWESKRLSLLQERQRVQSRVGEFKELSFEDKAVFYSSWSYVATFVATAIHDGQSISEIADELNFSREKVEDILKFLVQKGLCQIVNNKYQMLQSTIFIDNQSPLVIKHHTNWRVKAMEKMDQREKEELFYTSPMSLSKTDFARVRNLVSEIIEKSLKICRESPAEQVACLNIDFFKIRKG